MILKIWEVLEPWVCLIVFIIAEFLRGIERLALVGLYIVAEIIDTLRGFMKEDEFNVGNS